jgi:hypothetical protein
MRFDEQDRDWPSRPWIMAAIGAAGALIIHLLTVGHNYSTPLPVWKQAATTFTAVAVLSFLLTVELRRWIWAIAFALGWGVSIALVGWFTAQYNHVPDIFEFPFWSGILAVLIAAPLFQTIRDEGAWRFPYARLHRHAWTDAVTGAAGLAFTGITFLLAWLIASLFDVIGIHAIKTLLQKDWFGWMLAGFAFGGAVGILRERDALVATLQKLVMVIFSVLAPVLAVALAAFLASLPFTGLKGLWESEIPATPMLLLSGAGAILLANAVIGDGREERSANAWLQRSALVLVVCVLPLAFFAALSMGQRIGQYGWTPERMWGVFAVGIALAYGAAAWWAVFKGRQEFDDALRPLQTKLAIGLCGLALFLAFPIVDFGAISAASQMHRLSAGKVSPAEFDWKAMAFDFGAAGRARLKMVATSGPLDQRKLASIALASKNRYDVEQEVEKSASAAKLDQFLRVIPSGTVLSAAQRDAIAATPFCRVSTCIVTMIDDRAGLVAGQMTANGDLQMNRIRMDDKGVWTNQFYSVDEIDDVATALMPTTAPNLATVPVEVRKVERRQLFIDGKPIGRPFE